MKWLQRLTRVVRSSTGRLAFTYLSIIMLMSIGFSIVFYNASSHELNRQVPPDNFFRNQTANDQDQSTPSPRVGQFFQQRAHEGRQALLIRLLIVNSSALVAGSILSYQLARRTLRPIEAAMEAQVQFVSDASHELRTPLAAIRASNEVALRKPNLTVKEARELIDQNTRDVVRLGELSNGLLTLAAGNRQRVQLQLVSLQDVAADAMNQVIAAAAAKSVKVDDQIPDIKVQADRQLLAQMAVILLDNAVKYSHNRGTVYLSARPRGKFAYMEVKDEGIGIRASDLPHVFRRFYRADTSRGKANYHGYGLGLAIAEQIVARQHGEISVQSEPGKGTTFTVKLPLA